MQAAAGSRGVSRSTRATDGLPLEFNHRFGFSLHWIRSRPVQNMKSVGNDFGWSTLGLGFGIDPLN